MFAIFVVTLIALRILHWIFVELSHPKGFPRGPRFTLPLVGNALQLAQKDAFAKMRKKYGDAIGLWLGQHRTVVVCGFDLIQEVGSSEHCQGRARDEGNVVRGAAVMDGAVAGLISSEGRNWLEQRRFILHSLKDFGFGKQAMENILLDELEEFLQDLEKTNERPIDVQNDLTMMSINSLWRIVSGQRLSRTDPKIHKLHHKITTMLKEAFDPVCRVFIEYEFTRCLNKFVKMNCMVETIRDILDLISDAIKEHELTYQEDNSCDLIDAFLKEIKANENCPDSSFHGHSGRHNVKHTLVDLFIASSETTGSTIYWALLFMIHHPGVQDKVQHELDLVTGRNRLPCLADQDDTPYTNAVIHEIQRTANVVPIAVPHANSFQDVWLGNGKYFLPKGTLIMPDMASVLFNPEQFPDPHKFEPTRFINARGQFCPHPHVIPFGIGRRRCLGENLARQSLYLFFSGILSAFSILPEDPSNLPSLEPSGGVASVPPSYKIRFQTRVV